MAFIKKNFSFGTLASTLSAAATQLTMTAGHSLPTTTGEFRLVIWDAVTYPNPSDDSNVEIITGSFNAGNVYDITRAEESTSDVEHAAGSKVGLHFTVGVYESDLALVAASFKTFFLSDTGSGVGSLNYAYPHETTEAESTIVSAGLSTGNDQLIKGYITEVGEPGTTTIHAGIFPVHLHAKKGASNHKTTQLYAVLSSVDADGASNKITITTTNISDPLTDTEMAYGLHMSLAADLEVADTARLILDVYANVGSGSQDSVVTLYMEDNHDSYWSTAVDSGIWQNHSDKLDDLATTSATGAELTELTDSSETILHSHAGLGGAMVDRGDPATPDFVDTDLTTDGAWHDLDLSGILPAGNITVLLRIVGNIAAGGKTVRLKTKGNTNDANAFLAVSSISGVVFGADATVVVDAAEKLEYKTSNDSFTTLDITVAGWWL